MVVYGSRTPLAAGRRRQVAPGLRSAHPVCELRGGRTAPPDQHRSDRCEPRAPRVAAQAATVLLDLAATATIGWSWIDPVIALALAGWAIREGINAWHGDDCC